MVEGKQRVGMGRRNWPSVTVTTAETVGLRDNVRDEKRRDDTQDSTSRNIMLFSILYQSPYLSALRRAYHISSFHLSVQSSVLGRRLTSKAHSPSTPLHLRDVTSCGWLSSRFHVMDRYSPVFLLYQLILFFSSSSSPLYSSSSSTTHNSRAAELYQKSTTSQPTQLYKQQHHSETIRTNRSASTAAQNGPVERLG
jgi:hypothetical protein